MRTSRAARGSGDSPPSSSSSSVEERSDSMVEEVDDKADEECGEAVEEMMEGTGEGESQWSAPGENLLKKIVIYSLSGQLV